MSHWIPGPFAEKNLIRNFFISSFRLLQKYWRVGHPATKQLSRVETCAANFIPPANGTGLGSLKGAFRTISNLRCKWLYGKEFMSLGFPPSYSDSQCIKEIIGF